MVANPQRDDDIYRVYMTEEAFERVISVESPYRYELIDGIIYNMTGSTPEHSAIASNLLQYPQAGRERTKSLAASHQEKYTHQILIGQVAMY